MLSQCRAPRSRGPPLRSGLSACTACGRAAGQVQPGRGPHLGVALWPGPVIRTPGPSSPRGTPPEWPPRQRPDPSPPARQLGAASAGKTPAAGTGWGRPPSGPASLRGPGSRLWLAAGLGVALARLPGVRVWWAWNSLPSLPPVGAQAAGAQGTSGARAVARPGGGSVHPAHGPAAPISCAPAGWSTEQGPGAAVPRAGAPGRQERKRPRPGRAFRGT